MNKLKLVIVGAIMVLTLALASPAQAAFFFTVNTPAPRPSGALSSCSYWAYGSAESGYYQPPAKNWMVYNASIDPGVVAFANTWLGTYQWTYSCNQYLLLHNDGSRETVMYLYRPADRWYTTCTVRAAPGATHGNPMLSATCYSPMVQY